MTTERLPDGPWHEPWAIEHDHEGEDLVVDSERTVVAILDLVSSDARGRRVVAAVNACAGLPTSALEAGELGALIRACEEEGLNEPGIRLALRRLGRIP